MSGTAFGSTTAGSGWRIGSVGVLGTGSTVAGVRGAGSTGGETGTGAGSTTMGPPYCCKKISCE